jgi:hypothetical protein
MFVTRFSMLVLSFFASIKYRESRLSSFPYLFAHRDNCIRADNGAHCTTCALSVRFLCREIAAFVGYPRDDDTLFRAHGHTQAASFTPLSIYHNPAGHCVLSTPFGYCLPAALKQLRTKISKLRTVKAF